MYMNLISYFAWFERTFDMYMNLIGATGIKALNYDRTKGRTIFFKITTLTLHVLKFGMIFLHLQ